MKSCRFAFSCLRPDDRKIKMLDKIPDVVLFFYSKEVGHLSNVPHLQGYLELSKPIEAFALKTRYLKPYYVAAARSTRCANYLYCSKESDPVVHNPTGLDLF